MLISKTKSKINIELLTVNKAKCYCDRFCYAFSLKWDFFTVIRIDMKY